VSSLRCCRKRQCIRNDVPLVELGPAPRSFFIVVKSRHRYGAGAMHSSSRETVYPRMRLRVLVVLLGLGAVELCLSAAKAKAPLNLSVLARDGYGMVPISRPLPNSLVVRGNINGRDAKLVLDTDGALTAFRWTAVTRCL
jgi:hypothetical protein